MRKNNTYIFVSIVAITMIFAAFTDHRWEDWYITYKASKNLAMGKGLVYSTIGEKVHSFTSPLGTLAPAFLCFITGNISDDLVIWLYRILNAVLLGFTGILLYRIANYLNFNRISTIFLIGMFSLNILIVDFSINGMETAFMMLFLTYYISILLIPQEKLYIRLAFAFAALMFSRPDAIVYVLCIATGFFLFRYKLSESIDTRLKFIKVFFVSGGIAFLIYLPWLLWVWSYYGSPIPHTIVAKGLHMNYSFRKIFIDFTKFPGECLYLTKDYGITINQLFMPPYSWFGGWYRFHYGSKLLALFATFYFVWYAGKKEIRALSLALFLMEFYLFRISAQPVPWYLPNAALPCILTLAMIINSLYEYQFFANRKILINLVAGVALSYTLLIFIFGAYELRTHQRVIEFGNRKQIGLWLQEHAASPKDKVFIECLGYIGFYSGLKTYDFPGMSSPEMVDARRKLYTDNYAVLINHLKPDWLVLRPEEINNANLDMPGLLDSIYIPVKVFDVVNQIPDEPYLFGKDGYFTSDRKFTVFQLNK